MRVGGGEEKISWRDGDIVRVGGGEEKSAGETER